MIKPSLCRWLTPQRLCHNAHVRSPLASIVVGRHPFSTDTNSKQRISLTLYRQLLRWCNDAEDNIPLSYFIPPVYMKPPQIDEAALRALSEDNQASLFPPKTIIDPHQLTCPIHSPADAKSFFRAIFRLNKSSATPEDQQQHITLAFEGLRSLNELSQALADLKSNRERHVDREGVKFRVGQVVYHEQEMWRGVIVGWEKRDNPSEKAEPTSLTQKSYGVEPTSTIMYTVVLDSGDAHLHYSKRREANNLSVAEVHQSQLMPVEDESLLRIRSAHTQQHFKRFDLQTKLFVPNEIVGYEYPNDIVGTDATLEMSSSSEFASQEIVSGVKAMSEHLREVILGYTSSPEARRLTILASLLDRLDKISEGDVESIEDRFSVDPVPEDKRATLFLQRLFDVGVEINDLLWQQRRALENERPINFSLGDIVVHKEYGFRGVVVAWDPEPSVDVSRWDGLQHIENPEQYPFYHVIPDQNDCIAAFGGERPSRYVCEANLEMCPPERRNIHVDLEPEWEFESSDCIYSPPDDLKLKYGENLQDDGITSKCLAELRGAMSRLLVSIQNPSMTPQDSTIDTVSKKLSLDHLLELLKNANDMETATAISEGLKQIWKAHPSSDMRDRLDTAIGVLLSGNTESALTQFIDLIDEDPTYAEAWNKASTCEFMLGNMSASMEAAQKTLELIPTHFQAQNSLGLVYYEKREIAAAVDCFRKSMNLDPWSPVSARLGVCLDTLDQWKRTSGRKSDKP